MVKKTVAIVGAGKVGSALARAFHSRGYELVGIASKTHASASKLAAEFNVPAGIKAAPFTKYAQIVIIATPDRTIHSIVTEIAQDGGFGPGQVVLHTSGAISVETLEPARTAGAFTGSLHPLQSFTEGENSQDKMTGAYFALSGQKQALEQAEKIVAELNGHSFIILDQDKPLYHAAACITSNYMVSLMHWATQIYGQFGLSPQQATMALLPLLQGTMDNIQKFGPVDALTGPISRGDGITIKSHLEVLGKEKELYAALGLYTVDIALEKGTIDKQQSETLRNILTGRERVL